jgi:hypothetical protein
MALPRSFFSRNSLEAVADRDRADAQGLEFLQVQPDAEIVAPHSVHRFEDDRKHVPRVKVAFFVFRKDAVRRKSEVKRGETRLTDFSDWLIEKQNEADRLMAEGNPKSDSRPPQN